MGFSGRAIRSRRWSAQSFSAPVAICDPSTAAPTSTIRHAATAPAWTAMMAPSARARVTTASVGAGWTTRIAGPIQWSRAINQSDEGEVTHSPAGSRATACAAAMSATALLVTPGATRSSTRLGGTTKVSAPHTTDSPSQCATSGGELPAFVVGVCWGRGAF